tara:strand:+ start:215 stop:361 length:147 start_codon:yes stop_codon:yes gene_type:complete
VKRDLEALKDDLLSIENKRLIKVYKNELFKKNLELEDLKMRIMYLSCN